MSHETPKDGNPGTTDQSPRWEGPEENRPRGYLPAKDDPYNEKDAAGETLKNPDRQTLADAFATKNNQTPPRSADQEQPSGSLPEFTDPASSSELPTAVAQPDAPEYKAPPKDTEFAGHPEFSQDAAANKPPKGMGNSEPVDDNDEQTRHSDGVNPAHPSAQQKSGAGPALARHSKDTQVDDALVALIVGAMMIFVAAGIAAMIILFRSHSLTHEEKDQKDYEK